MGGIDCGDLLWCAFGNNGSAPNPAFGAKVDQPVSSLNHVEVVLNDQHGVALVDKTAQHREQAADIFKVQTGRRFIEQINGVTGGALREFGRQLHSLGFTTDNVGAD